jgi:hypothetical protein
LNSKDSVVGDVKCFEEIGDALILGTHILHKPLTTHHILANNMVALLCVLHNVTQLFHCLEEQHINHLQIYYKQEDDGGSDFFKSEFMITNRHLTIASPNAQQPSELIGTI